MASKEQITKAVTDVLHGIREVGSPYYQKTVPEYDGSMLLNNYGAIIFGKNAITNEFLYNFEQLALFEATKQHIFENPFSQRFKQKSDVGRAKTFTTFVNPINPLQYDGEAMDRILHLYKRDVKTAYFFRNREDIFPVSVNADLLASAFQSEEALYQFIQEFYTELSNSNAIVEWNAIKQTFATNAKYGALKIVNLHGKTSKEKWAIIKEYMLNMQMPSSEYNNYINIEGATGDPVVTFTPKEDLLLIPKSKFITDIELDVMASAFQLEYAKAIENIIPVNDFGYNIYDRENQQILGYEQSNIECILCDEAIIHFKEQLSASNEMVNAATRVNQHFWHVWQQIQLLPWANCVVFVDEPDEAKGYSVNFNPTPILSEDIPIKLSMTDVNGTDISSKFTSCTAELKYIKTASKEVTQAELTAQLKADGITDAGDLGKISTHVLNPTNALLGVQHNKPDTTNFCFRTSENVLTEIQKDSTYNATTGDKIIASIKKLGITNKSMLCYELGFTYQSIVKKTNLYTGIAGTIDKELVKWVLSRNN